MDNDDVLKFLEELREIWEQDNTVERAYVLQGAELEQFLAMDKKATHTVSTVLQ